MTKQLAVYFVGVVALGVFYESLKASTGGGFKFVLVATAYLIFLRAVGYAVAKIWPRRASGQE